MGDRRLRPVVRRALVGVAALVVLAGIAYATTYSWLFHADAVHVEGAVRMTAGEVRRLGRLDVGTNLFHLDEAAVAQQLRKDPRVASATVSTDLPDVATIRVVERIPVATADVAGGTVIVAGDGELLPGGPASRLPEMRAIAGDLDEAARRASAEALAALEPGVRRAVAAIVSGTDGDVVLELRDGVTVTYGPASDLAAKAAALRVILAWSRGEGIDLVAIDVSVPSAPTARTAHSTVTPG